MEYFGEHEFGFSNDRLGFPSIKACRAIVYQTSNGLFGFHNYGGSAPNQWDGRAQEFASFVTGHPLGNTPGFNLYVTTFAAEGSGYGSLAEWKGEAKAFAKALKYKGTRSGFNLSNTYKNVSAYVEYRRVGSVCIIMADAWNDDPGVNARPTAAIANPQDHQFRPGPKPRPVYTSVTTSNLTRIVPESLM
jgi:hypothetical protein